MGTFYNRARWNGLNAATELMRNRLRMSYAALEEKGVFLPLVEAHLEFQGGARYDDLLRITSPWNCKAGEVAFRRGITRNETGSP